MVQNDLPEALDQAAISRFERLYRASAPEVIAYVARRVPIDGVADVVAETFAVSWRRLERVPDDPLPWLLGVARRVIANQRRSQRRQQALREKAAAEPAALPQLDLDVSLSEVVAALSKLPERDREVLRLAAWEGLSAGQASRVLGCSATAYRLRLHRARRKLAARLDSADGLERQEPLQPTLRPEELP